MHASKGILAEDGLVSASEGEVSGFDEVSNIVSDRQADMEDLAVVVHVS